MRPTLTAQLYLPRVIPWIESTVASVSISETYSFGPGLPGTPYPYRTPVPLLVPPTPIGTPYLTVAWLVRCFQLNSWFVRFA